jgi:hypothetical protein
MEEEPIPISELVVGRRYRIRHKRYPGATEVGRFDGASIVNDKIVGAWFNQIRSQVDPNNRIEVLANDWTFYPYSLFGGRRSRKHKKTRSRCHSTHRRRR